MNKRQQLLNAIFDAGPDNCYPAIKHLNDYDDEFIVWLKILGFYETVFNHIYKWKEGTYFIQVDLVQCTVVCSGNILRRYATFEVMQREVIAFRPSTRELVL